MAKHTSHESHESSEESSERVALEKKLRRREKKLRERLQEAREAQADALERLKRAERRLEKRTARTQRLETRLTLAQQQLSIMQHPETQVMTTSTVGDGEGDGTNEVSAIESAVAQSSSAEQSVFDEQNEPAVPAGEEREQLEELAQLVVNARVDSSTLLSSHHDADATAGLEEIHDEVGEAEKADDELILTVKNIVSPTEAGRLAKIARSVAETAERAARVAIERAVEVATRLEQMSAGRHLAQELAQTQSDADRVSVLAQHAQRAAEEAELLMVQTGMVGIVSMAGMDETLETGENGGDEENALADEAMTEEQLLTTLEAMAQEDEVFAGGPELQEDDEDDIPRSLESMEMPESVEDIEDEEEMIEAIASKLIADAAAAAAAQAEALAEASSARTREARQDATRADRILDEARASMLNGSLNEGEAQSRLREAERDATRAHALLADAEAAEEAAREAARNAEAEAEVAEGMAFATGDIAERQIEADMLEHKRTVYNNGNIANGNDVEYNDDSDATDKIPRP